MPALQFGGVGEPGFGRIQGHDGLKEFTYTNSITRQKCKPHMILTQFPRPPKT